MPVNTFGSAKTVLGRCPSKNVLLITRNRFDGGNGLDSLVSKSVGEKLHIPGMSVRNLEIRNCRRQGISSDRQEEMVVNGVPYRTPRSRLDGGVTCMNLVDRVGGEIILDLQD